MVERDSRFNKEQLWLRFAALRLVRLSCILCVISIIGELHWGIKRLCIVRVLMRISGA